MAELTNECCTSEAQETCCEASAKASCCGESHGERCGCSAGSAELVTATAAATLEQVRETVRKRYASAATAAASGGCCSTPAQAAVFGASLYADSDASDAPDAAINVSLGCGVPTAVADLRDGETVLDLGSGGGADVIVSARRVAPSGRAIGLDMTDEMLDLARANALEAGVDNVEFVKGYLEDVPLPHATG